MVIKPYEIWRTHCCYIDYYLTGQTSCLVDITPFFNFFLQWLFLLGVILALRLAFCFFIITLITNCDALSYSFVPTLQKLPNSTNLTDCWIYARTNNTHNTPELVTWPPSLWGWRNLSGQNAGFSFGVSETTHKLPSGKQVPDVTNFHWVPLAHKENTPYSDLVTNKKPFLLFCKH